MHLRTTAGIEVTIPEHGPAPMLHRTSDTGGAILRTTRSGGVVSAMTGGVAGIAPHLLHHLAPILGAALLTGATGTLLFGALGLVFTVPMLVQLKRKFRSWAAPAVALLVFAMMFSVSTFAIGPFVKNAFAGETTTADASLHELHHQGQQASD